MQDMRGCGRKVTGIRFTSIMLEVISYFSTIVVQTSLSGRTSQNMTSNKREVLSTILRFPGTNLIVSTFSRGRHKGIISSWSFPRPALKVLLCVSFLTTAVTFSKAFAHDETGILTCSFVSILANPGSFEGRLVNTQGFLTTKDQVALWLSEGDYTHEVRYNAVKLSFTANTKFHVNGRSATPPLLKCHGQSVTLEGRYSREDVNVLEPYPAGKIIVDRVVISSPLR